MIEYQKEDKVCLNEERVNHLLFEKNYQFVVKACQASKAFFETQ